MRNIIADYREVTSGRAAFDTWHFWQSNSGATLGDQ